MGFTIIMIATIIVATIFTLRLVRSPYAPVAFATFSSEQMIDKFFASIESVVKAVIAKLTGILIAICWPLAGLLVLAGIILWAAGDRFHGQRLLLGALVLAALAVVLGAI